jgi:transposase
MTRPFSPAFKTKMVERLTGRHAVSANQLSRETGVSQQSLSRWLEEARSLPLVPPTKRSKTWTIDEKIKILGTAATLSGEQLASYLEREGLHLAELEQWRLALDEGGRASTAVTRRIHGLERELARKEKALAEAAALLVLKKKLHDAFGEEDDDTDEENEK